MTWSVRSSILNGAADSWVAAGSLMHLDFVNDRYAVNGKRTTLGNITSFTRASTTWGLDASGNLVSAPSGVPLVIPGKGFLSSSQRANTIRNNSNVGGVAPSTRPTYVESFNGAGITRTYAYGSVGGIPYMDVTFNGTASDAIGPDIRFDASTQIVAANGQTWTLSGYCAIVGGSITNISAIKLQYFVRDSGAVNLVTVPGTDFKGSLTSTPQRFSVSSTIANASAAYVQPMLVIGYNSGAVINITLRIYLAQMEGGAYASAPILTTNGAVTRYGDVTSLLDPSLMPITGSDYVEWEEVVGTSTASTITLMKRVDGSNNIQIGKTSGGSSRIISIFAGATQYDLIGLVSPPVSGGIYRTAHAYAVNDFAAAFSSSLSASIITDVSGSILSADGSVGIGANPLGSSQPDGFIRQIITYPIRRTNTQILGWAQQKVPDDDAIQEAPLDVDFSKSAYRNYGIRNPLLGFTRGSVAYDSRFSDPLTIDSFATDVPRLRDDGLLMGPAATRLSLNPQNPQAWSNAGATLTNLSADGQWLPVRAASAGQGYHGVYLAPGNLSTTSGTPVSLRVRYKAGTSNRFRVAIYAPTPATTSYIDGSPGALAVVSNGAGSISNLINTNLGGGLYEVAFTLTPNVTMANGQVYVSSGSTTVGQYVDVYGGQVTNTPYPREWILGTVGSTQVVAQDVLRCTAAQAGLIASEGFAILRTTILGTDPASNGRLLALEQSSNLLLGRIAFIQQTSGKPAIWINDETSTLVASTEAASAISGPTDVTMSIAWGGGTCLMRIGSAAAVADASAASPAAMTTMTLGARADNSAASFARHRRLVFGSLRPSDANLNAMHDSVRLAA